MPVHTYTNWSCKGKLTCNLGKIIQMIREDQVTY